MTYDYSEVPPIELRWDLDPEAENWVEVRLQPEGLLYYGEDWTFPDGGPYTAGFQAYEEFFASGPLCQMPEALADRLRAHLEAHRRAGGVRLVVTHEKPESLDLVGVWLHLDGTWVFGMDAGALRERTRRGALMLYTGVLEAAPHQLSGVFAYRAAGESAVIKMTLDYDFTLENHPLRLVLRPDPKAGRLVVSLET